MYCDYLRCKNCKRLFVFQVSKPWSPDKDQESSETETAVVAVACPECKHVYDYSDQKPQSLPTPWGESDDQTKTPTVFHVPLSCDTEDCEARLVVIAARAAGTTLPELEVERTDWTLHDLKCPENHPITKASRP